jgi:4-amino-4-deoxy-L-arabinose transferase-like glycosyltransferase
VAPVEGWQRTIILAVISGIYLVLATTWSVMIPAWEANDEMDHTANIEHIAANGTLPPIEFFHRFPMPGNAHLRRLAQWHESHQPPLYYYLASLWQRLLGIRPFHPNPLDRSDWQGEPPARLIFVHDYDEEHRHQAEALHWLRLFSVIVGLITLLLTYQAASMVLHDSALALSCAAFVGFLPKFVIVSAVVSNDGLVILFSTLTMIWLLVYLQQEKSATWKSFLYAMVAGASLGAAVISKVNSLPLFPVLLLGLCLTERPIHLRTANALLASFGFLAVSGWWFRRNWELYHELFGEGAATSWLRSLLPDTIAPVPWFDFQRFFIFLPRSLIRSMWYSGGANQFAAPMACNLALFLAAVIAIIAGISAFRRNRGPSTVALDQRQGWILIGWIVASLAALIVIARYTAQAEGRITYPGLAAFAILAVLGTDYLARRSRQSSAGRFFGCVIWPCVFLGFNAYVFASFVWPFRGL